MRQNATICLMGEFNMSQLIQGVFCKRNLVMSYIGSYLTGRSIVQLCQWPVSGSLNSYPNVSKGANWDSQCLLHPILILEAVWSSPFNLSGDAFRNTEGHRPSNL